MTEFLARLEDLRRPRLLMRAARFGLSDYRRDRDLKRLVACPGSPEATVNQLLSQEGKLEENRQRGDAAYSIARHIEVLIALLAEIRLVAPGT
ncbi:MAG: DUF6477 family protein [Pseudotabrizicola sp.]|uniref:DUF6477 family protein n=1 Tax=Pseudotabrizicola sp. TaxID=2939647 RepID=UPI002715C84C|nr:DUF6477 family protein [Pseudotabrizicola sp.]MDO8882390.1 DUF6477 family protein [Pseudotabrizicola sp.]MDP2082608.1 DUF6477 family protein [Pseudotabrizicola sp.]MDZ7573504.1 DUF6477 family protein [Pseudotabrizicola sp.]